AGEYQHFITQHGGSNNAWTGTEHSHFFFDSDNQHFEPALARFADMFCQPLFAADYVEKERHAIEAEFSLKLKDDSRRIYQVHKETVNPRHPFAKFSVGNLLTLADTEAATLQQALQQFFTEQYSANRMTLCLVSPWSLAQQQQWVAQYFSALPDKLAAKAALDMPLYLPEQQGLQLNIQPHKTTHKLVASFAMPDIQPWYPYKAVSFIAHLLGDEGPGSLLSYLKQQGLVNQLSAGGGIDGSNYKDFTVAFELTEAGLADQTAVLTALFSTIALLKHSPFPEHLFKERQSLLQLAYRYPEPANALQTASQLSVNMQHYPPEDVLFGDYRMELPPIALYQQLLGYLRASNMRLMLISPAVDVDRAARWYQTPYSITLLAKNVLQQLDASPLLADIQLPASNPYIMDELQLQPEHTHQPLPVRLLHEPQLSVWFKTDTEFATPKGHIFLQLTLPNCIASTDSMAASRLWVELFTDQINQQLYTATTAGLNYHLHVQRQGISIHTSGLSANQSRLLQDILALVPHLTFSEARFDELKMQLCRHWENSSKNKPVARLFSQLSALLQPLNPDIHELQQRLQQLSYDDFCQFNQQLLQQVHLEALMLGNWQQHDAAELITLLRHWQQQLPSVGRALPSPPQLIKGIGPLWLQQQVEHNDQALVIYLPGTDKTPQQIARFMLANHLMSPRYFHQLRTEQQMGYLVGTGYVPINTLPGMAFYIQSPNFSCADLYQATLAFFHQFLADCQALSEEEFVDMKQGLSSQLAERDASLGARAKRIWLAIGQSDHQFDLSQRITAALQELPLKDFIAFLQRLLASDYDAVMLGTSAMPAHSRLKQISIGQWQQMTAAENVFDSQH
uniref:insulinase family protein n=1 Tax=Arsukibacterium sp. TaxID=1977258 RepID=UPI002FDB5829